MQFEHSSGKPGDNRYLPLSEVKNTMLLDGQLEWLGALERNEQKDFKARIKFPEEGEWEAGLMILGKSDFGRDLTLTSEPDRYTSPPQIGPYLKIYVGDKYSQFGFPPDYSSGQSEISLPNEYDPLIGFIDTDKPPGLNEPVVLTWGFGSTWGWRENHDRPFKPY